MDILGACCVWLGVTLGEPEGDVLARLGEVTMHTLPTGETSVEYAIDHARAKEDVVFKNGRVALVALQQSGWTEEPSTLADFARHPARKNGSSAVWKYGYDKGRVTGVSLAATNAALAGLPAVASAPVLHGGTSFEDALINGAADEASSSRNEDNYLEIARCNSGHDTWRVLSQSLVWHDGHPFDYYKLACSAGAEQRELYFNISSSFGKL